MKNFKYCILVVMFFLGHACNDETFLEIPDAPNEINCLEIYSELSNIRVAQIGKAAYNYEVIDGEKKLVEIIHGSSYATIFYIYQDGRLHLIERYDRLTETFTNFEEFIYSDGLVVRTNHFTGTVDNPVEEFMFFTTYRRDEQNRIIESKSYKVENGVEELSSKNIFEYDDCNMIQSKLYLDNDKLASTNTLFYDDKANPDNLSANIITTISQSANNIIRIESVDAEMSNSEIYEYTYNYNDLGLPIQRRFNEFDKLDYSYVIE